MADERLILAYEAVGTLLDFQDRTLGNLRNRASNLLTVTALITSVAGGLGLINTDPTKGPTLSLWAAGLLLLIFVATGTLVMAILWPAKNWAYAIAPNILLKHVDDGKDVDSIRRATITALDGGLRANQNAIERRSVYYRTAVLLLLVEIVALIIALYLQGTV